MKRTILSLALSTLALTTIFIDGQYASAQQIRPQPPSAPLSRAAANNAFKGTGPARPKATAISGPARPQAGRPSANQAPRANGLPRNLLVPRATTQPQNSNRR